MNTARGFSLIETLVYTSIFAVISVLVINMTLSMASIFGKVRTQRNVHNQGAAALERILREIRLATSVATSSTAFATNPGKLALNTIVSSADTTPIIRSFFVSVGDIVLQENAASPFKLTNGITIANLTFHAIHGRIGTITHFVRGAFAGCSDTNDGRTPETAFCTISKAASVVAAGDVVLVGAATYNETVTISTSGSAESSISFIADTTGAYTGDGGSVIVDGVTNGFELVAPSAALGTDYIVIEGFHITGSDAGIRIPHASDFYELRSNTIWENTEGIELDASWGNCAFTASTNGIIENNELFNNTNGIYFRGAKHDDVIIQTNNIHDNVNGIQGRREGGCESADNMTIQHNAIYNNSQDGIYAGPTFDGTIFNNRIHNNGRYGVYYEYRSGTTLQPITLRNNTVRANGDIGIRFGTAMNSVTTLLENNIITENADDGIESRNPFGLTTCGVVRNNDVWNNAVFNYDGCPDLTGTNGNISGDPLYVNTTSSDFHLRSVSTGHGTDSPAINAGYQNAADIGLDVTSTRTDNVIDTGIVDMGHHYGALPFGSSILLPGTPVSEAVRVELIVEGGFGKLKTIESLYGTAVLRRSY